MKKLLHIALLVTVALTIQSCFSTRSDTSTAKGTATVGTNAPATGNQTSRSPGNTFSSDGNGNAVSPTAGARTVTDAAGAMGTANTTGDAGNESTMSSTTSAAETARFIRQAVINGISDMAYSNLALKNGQSSAVKDFAAMAVQHYENANTELKALARARDITLTGSTDKDLEKLSSSAAKNFDQKYVKLMIKNHRTAVSLLENGSKLSDPETKAYAVKHLPKWKMQLQQVIELEKNIKQ